MILRRFTDFVLHSRVQAMAVAFLFSFIPLIGTASILIAGLVTLRKGAFEGALVLFAATVPYAINYALTPAPYEINLTMVAFAVIVVSNVLTWVFAIVLRHYANWNITLELAAMLGILVVLVVHVFYPDVQQWWEKELNAYFNKAAEMVDSVQAEKLPKEAQAELVAVAKHYATGFIAAAVLFNALLQLVLARWWQGIIFNPGGLRKELYRIRLGQVAGVIFIAALILSYWENDTVLDIMPILYLTFAAAGLSLIHSIMALANKSSWIWLLLIYIGIIWLFPLSLMAIAILALADTFVDIRRQVGRLT